jgi:hypothetical protein
VEYKYCDLIVQWFSVGGRMGEMRSAYKVSVGKPEAKNQLEDLVIDGRIILEWISKK